MANDEDFAQHELSWFADSDGQRRTPVATVGGRGADEVTLAGTQHASDRFAGGHGQIAWTHLAPMAAVVFAGRNKCFRFVTVTRDVHDLLAVHDGGGLAPHLPEVFRLRDGDHIPLSKIIAVTDGDDGRVPLADLEPSHDPISIVHLLRLLHGPETALDDGAFRLPLLSGFIEHISSSVNAAHRAGVGSLKSPKRTLVRKECAMTYPDRSLG